jgi:2,4-dienoyl-CoA reductase-like NADH-dependent reductase (Old Yellow Enzyme family)
MPLNDILFAPLALPRITLPSRLVRSATYEGLGARDGSPRPELGDLYARLARSGVGTVVTGFCFVSQQGRAMQPGQCGISADDALPAWSSLVRAVKAAAPQVKLIMQLAHAGRQTRRAVTGQPAVGASARRCLYFREKVRPLAGSEIESVIASFADAARRAQQAGFDGVQLHAAHGYLLHQFLSPYTNTRQDEWADGARLLTEVLRAVKAACGDAFPVLAKFSAADDRGLTVDDTVCHIRAAEPWLDAAEISYGTMEFGLNIIRGAWPLERAFEVNPLFQPIPRPLRGLFKRVFLPPLLRRRIAFAENYNLAAAARIAREVTVPVLAVGGFRRAASLRAAVTEHGLAAASLCRPFLCEPDLARRLREDDAWSSSCTNCNLCTVSCDAPHPVRCLRRAAH